MIFGDERATVILGSFGSGKTEVAINLALHIALQSVKKDVCLADIDLVNPYFRSREKLALLEKNNVRVIVPDSGKLLSELPILVPEVRSALKSSTSYCILDVGGDDVGARVLGSLQDALQQCPKRVLFVLNARRPDTATVERAADLLARIESAARLKVTGLVVNTHLMQETNFAVLIEGVRLAKYLHQKTSLPVEFITCPRKYVHSLRQTTHWDILPMTKVLTFPWQIGGSDHSGANRTGKDLFHL